MQRDPLTLRAWPASVGAVAVVLAVSAHGCGSSSRLACPSSPLACPSLDGARAFCTFAAWGCPKEPACGGLVGVVDVTVDGELTYIYAAATGAYVATIAADPGGGDRRCADGPSSVTVPEGCAFTPLAACAPLEEDGGIGPTDASPDAPDAGNPAGSPSSQPFVAPPVDALPKRP